MRDCSGRTDRFAHRLEPEDRAEKIQHQLLQAQGHIGQRWELHHFR